ncbi:MAG: hypothetical protein KIT84_10805 [Labilithrix sp.]|nr:hypothetical protein [Labilithrix sp.]MCW5811496.1 hypothetical protein [Labilithrix sp.]
MSMTQEDPKPKEPRVFRSGVYARLHDAELPDSDRTVEDVIRHAREAGARAEAAHEDTNAVLAESHAVRTQARLAAAPDEHRMRELRERLHRWQAAVRERNGDP